MPVGKEKQTMSNDEYQPMIPELILGFDDHHNELIGINDQSPLSAASISNSRPPITVRCNCCGKRVKEAIRMGGAFYCVDVDDCIYYSRGGTRISPSAGYVNNLESWYTKNHFEGWAVG